MLSEHRPPTQQLNEQLTTGNRGYADVPHTDSSKIHKGLKAVELPLNAFDSEIHSNGF
uniref:Uncharacterized protein n=1 Tax=Anguilla anguilla TaxID=7936 RepID=A0A0E9R2B4_ANGAN